MASMSGGVSMIILSLIIAYVVLYWIGGQKWAHTLFRDVGCQLCLAALCVLLLGWSWGIVALLISIGGSTIGDHEAWSWSIHGFVIAIGMVGYAFFLKEWCQFAVMVAVVTVGTFTVSRFFYRGGWDVYLRGLLYATMPLWFLIR